MNSDAGRTLREVGREQTRNLRRVHACEAEVEALEAEAELVMIEVGELKNRGVEVVERCLIWVFLGECMVSEFLGESVSPHGQRRFLLHGNLPAHGIER